MEENIVYIFLAFLIISFLSLKFYKSRTHRKSNPPSPPAIPLIGHLHLLKKPLHHSFHNLSQKYGPIISLRFGSLPVVVVSSPSMAQECFTKKNDIIFANRPRSLAGKHFGYKHTTLAQASYGDHWRNLRRISTIEIFSSHRLNILQDIRQDEVKRLLKNLASCSLQDFGRVEMKSKFQNLTFNIMMRMIAGKRYYEDDASASNENEAKAFRAMVNETRSFGGTLNPRNCLPILDWIDGGIYEKKMINVAQRSDEFYQRIIDEYKIKNGKLENTNTLISHLLSLQQSEPEYYTNEIIKGLIQVMLLAGTDTSAVTLEWALSALINRPSMLRKAREEIDNQVGEGCLLGEHHLSKLPYLQNIISETLRLHPAAPLLVPHVSSDDCTVGGYNIPRGTMLLVNAWAIHRDPRLWDDPTSFKPERFEGEGELGYKLMPFGLGRRACPGSGLAQRVVGLTLGSLIQCFEWKKVSDEEVDMKELGTGGLIAPKAEPLEVMCKARPIMNKIFSQSLQYS